ncbi:Uncharacterised protein [uncultured archaeon]|nr:Uncharacterised protein [uncultured archaeon]
MAYVCTKCTMMKGLTAPLVKDQLSDALVCSHDSRHRYKVDENGFLRPAE